MPAASPVGNLTDFLIFHLQHGNDFALHTHIVLPAPCLNVHHRVWHRCPGLILISFKNKAASVRLHRELHARITARWRIPDMQKFTHRSLTSNPSRWTQSRLPDSECNQQNGLRKTLLKPKPACSISPPLAPQIDQWWFCLMMSVCISDHLLQCVNGRDMFGFGTTNRATGSLLESGPKKAESISLTICTHTYFLPAVHGAKNRALFFPPVLSRQV